MYLWSARANGQQSNNALVQVGERLRTLNTPYRTVFVVDSPWYAGMHVVAFSGMTPGEYQRTHQAVVDARGWDYITSVGKYRFVKPREMPAVITSSCASVDRVLLVSRARVAGVTPIDSVAWTTDKYYFTDLSSRAGCP
jgi:hypothetical protein